MLDTLPYSGQLQALREESARLYNNSVAGADRNLIQLRQNFADYCAKLTISTKPVIRYCDVPTGLGKSLSLLRLAYRIARKFKCKRIVVVLPFLTLCRQTESRYRFWLDPDDVGNASSEGKYANKKLRKLGRSWKYPITITTSVDYLRAAAVIPVHRPTTENIPVNHKACQLEDSVVIFDDADQWLQPHMVPHIMLGLQALNKYSNTHPILVSATLPHYWDIPEFLHKDMSVSQVSIPIGNTHRTKITFAEDVTFSRIADLLNHHRAVPCVIGVNTVLTATNLGIYLNDKLRDRDVRVITSRLASAHRNEKEREYAARLAQKDPRLIIVATSCIQAGWDVSFGFGMRERSCLNDLHQLNGRVNRNGEYGIDVPVISFTCSDPLSRANPSIALATAATDRLWAELDDVPGAEHCTKAMEYQIEASSTIYERIKDIEAASRARRFNQVLRLLSPDIFVSNRIFAPLSTIPSERVRRKIIEGRISDPEVLSYLIRSTPATARMLQDLGLKVMTTKDGEEYYILADKYYDPQTGMVIDPPQD